MLELHYVTYIPIKAIKKSSYETILIFMDIGSNESHFHFPMVLIYTFDPWDSSWSS